MKTLLIVLTFGLGLSSCSKDDCIQEMRKCNDEVGVCSVFTVEMPCGTEDGYSDGTYTYRSL